MGDYRVYRFIVRALGWNAERPNLCNLLMVRNQPGAVVEADDPHGHRLTLRRIRNRTGPLPDELGGGKLTRPWACFAVADEKPGRERERHVRYIPLQPDAEANLEIKLIAAGVKRPLDRRAQ